MSIVVNQKSGPIIVIPEELRIFENSFLKNYDIKITLSNNLTRDQKLEVGKFYSVKHEEFSKHYYCTKCGRECKVSKKEKEPNFTNPYLFIRFEFNCKKGFSMNIFFDEKYKVFEIEEKVRDVKKLYWNKSIYTVLEDNLETVMQDTGMTLVEILEKDYKDQIKDWLTTEENEYFYKKEKKIIERKKTGIYRCEVAMLYHKDFVDDIKRYITI